MGKSVVLKCTRIGTPVKLADMTILNWTRAICVALAFVSHPLHAALEEEINRAADAVEERVVAWRRDIHAHPELSNREYRTSELVAAHLRSLGLEVQTGIAHTGVVAVLHGGKPGRVVALRADMDALPVVEKTGLPYASTVRSMYEGKEVGVMHACGHDNHVAILMGVAEVLSGHARRYPGHGEVHLSARGGRRAGR